MTESCDAIVIGGGVGGCTAALYAVRYGLDVALLEMGLPGGQVSTTTIIENYPGFPEGISGPELAQRVQKQAQNAGVKFFTAQATAITPAEDGRWFVKTTKATYDTAAVIIATGAFPRSLRVPGEAELRGHGVSYCATCDGFFFRGKTVAVVGGGNTAIEEALYLADITSKVFVIHRRDELRADKYMQDRLFARENIEVIWDSVVDSIEGDTVVTGANLKNTKTDEVSHLTIDGLFVAIGHIAKTEWLADLLELDDSFIVTDERMQTSRQGIFACGDIRTTPLRQVATAVGDAAIAAFSAHQYVSRWKDAHR